MSGVLRVLVSRVAPVVRGQTMNLHAAPAKEKIGAVESAVGLSLFAVSILGPSGWILAHLEDYKKKD